ncbi:hypothetical protein [Streptomyces aureus]
MTSTDPLNLDAIETRATAATPGPWRLCDDYSDVLNPDGYQLASYAATADGEFIAHAPEDVRTLVAEVRRLRTELAEYEPLSPQQCLAGKHADWLVDSEYAHACPWCQIEQQKADARVQAIRDLADKAAPQRPEISFFGDHGQQVGAWMRKQAEYEQQRLAAEETHVVADDSEDPEHVDDCPGCATTAR